MWKEGLLIALLYSASAAWIEGYWEAWNMDRTSDYASSFSKVAYGSIGSGSNLNIVDLSFSDYTFGRDSQGRLTIGYINYQTAPDGSTYTVDKLKADIQAVHSKGGIVKLSFGGATFSMSRVITSYSSADNFVSNVVEVVSQDNLDGVDFDVEDGSTSSDLQVYMLTKLRSALPSNKSISYTMPATAQNNYPYKDVLQQAGKYLTAVNVMCYDVYWSGYNPLTDFQQIAALGVPMNKIVWGVMPGCHDAPNEYTSVDDAKSIAQQVKDHGMAGAMMWDINRDTNHRSTSGCINETGQPDGTYTNIFASAFRGT